MIEEQGTVVAVESGAVWVETLRASTCGSCQARNGCGHKMINQQQGGQRARLRVPCEGGYQPGDQVVLGLAEDALLAAALWVYGLPLLLLFVGAVLGSLLPLQAVDGAALFGVAGLLAGFLINRQRSGQEAAGYQPRLLRRVDHCQVVKMQAKVQTDNNPTQ